MRWLTVLLLTPLLAAVPPLEESQRVRLETADDGSTTVDEAAFYALLENAADWPKGDHAGATIPDYDAVRADPEAHRGQLFLIEGRVQMLLPEARWSRSGWESVRGLVLRVDDKPDGEKATADDLVIVHLIEPPGLTRSLYRGVPVEFNDPVRLVARFHKIVSYTRRNGEGQVLYPNFVGRRLTWMGESSGMGSTGLAMLLLSFAIAGMIFLIWRIRHFNRTSQERYRTATYLAEKRAQRESSDYSELDEAVDQSGLPDDPADALNALKSRHREKDDD